MSKAKIARGKRKVGILEEAEFRKDTITLEWIKTQPTWAEDMAYYKESIKTEEKTKSKGKK